MEWVRTEKDSRNAYLVLSDKYPFFRNRNRVYFLKNSEVGLLTSIMTILQTTSIHRFRLSHMREKFFEVFYQS